VIFDEKAVTNRLKV